MLRARAPGQIIPWNVRSGLPGGRIRPNSCYHLIQGLPGSHVTAHPNAAVNSFRGLNGHGAARGCERRFCWQVLTVQACLTHCQDKVYSNWRHYHFTSARIKEGGKAAEWGSLSNVQVLNLTRYEALRTGGGINMERNWTSSGLHLKDKYNVSLHLWQQ